MWFTLGPRILAQKTDVDFLEWSFRLYPSSDSDLHPEVWRYGLFAHLATPDVFTYLDSHPWQIELASPDLQGLRHPTMASLLVRMSTLYRAVRQAVREAFFLVFFFSLQRGTWGGGTDSRRWDSDLTRLALTPKPQFSRHRLYVRQLNYLSLVVIAAS